MSREKPEACECCDYETPALTAYKVYTSGSNDKVELWYCELCALTQTSAFSRYPHQTPSNTDVLKTICLVGNRILAAIEAGKGGTGG